MEVCENKQKMEKTTFKIYDSLLQSSFTINKVGDSEFQSVYVHDFEIDPSLFAVNNISVFSKGLLDLAKARNGVPFIISAPHFLHGQSTFNEKLKMNQSDVKHKSIVSFLSYSKFNPFYAINQITRALTKPLNNMSLSWLICDTYRTKKNKGMFACTPKMKKSLMLNLFR